MYYVHTEVRHRKTPCCFLCIRLDCILYRIPMQVCTCCAIFSTATRYYYYYVEKVPQQLSISFRTCLFIFVVYYFGQTENRSAKNFIIDPRGKHTTARLPLLLAHNAKTRCFLYLSKGTWQTSNSKYSFDPGGRQKKKKRVYLGGSLVLYFAVCT